MFTYHVMLHSFSINFRLKFIELLGFFIIVVKHMACNVSSLCMYIFMVFVREPLRKFTGDCSNFDTIRRSVCPVRHILILRIVLFKCYHHLE